MVTGPNQMKQGQVWVKKTTVGLEFMEQMCFGTVLQKKKEKKYPPLLTSSSESSHCYALWRSKAASEMPYPTQKDTLNEQITHILCIIDGIYRSALYKLCMLHLYEGICWLRQFKVC